MSVEGVNACDSESSGTVGHCHTPHPRSAEDCRKLKFCDNPSWVLTHVPVTFLSPRHFKGPKAPFIKGLTDVGRIRRQHKKYDSSRAARRIVSGQ